MSFFFIKEQVSLLIQMKFKNYVTIKNVFWTESFKKEVGGVSSLGYDPRLPFDNF